jgi:hypothetical protein
MTLLILCIVLNLLAHFFLVRFFRWYSNDTRINPSGKPLKTKMLSYVLLIPPLALVTAVLLVGIGLILQIFSKRKK